MITKIQIKDIASYDSTGVEINDLKKINFFFGYNGSGKSTITKYLKDLSVVEVSERNNDFKNCSQVGYDPASNEILAFNEQFVDANFRSKKTLKGIFSLDAINGDIATKIENRDIYRKLLDKIIIYRGSLIDKIDTKRSDKCKTILDKCYEERRRFEIMGNKITNLLPRNKDTHLQKIKSYINSINGVDIETIDNIQEKFQNLYEKELTNIPINIDWKLYHQIRIIENKIRLLLNAVIIGNEDVDIAKLISELNNRKWVESGVTYLDQSKGKCPFCQQDTTDIDLTTQFGAFFNSEYKLKISTLETLSKDYEQLVIRFLQK